MNDPIRILLVDDSPHFLAAVLDFLNLNQTLRVNGLATDGQEALKQASILNPHIILLDLHLGNESGLTLIPRFKELLPHTKIIILTMAQEDSYRVAALRAGADYFLGKSTSVQTLIATITQLMDRQDETPSTQEPAT